MGCLSTTWRDVPSTASSWVHRVTPASSSTYSGARPKRQSGSLPYPSPFVLPSPRRRPSSNPCDDTIGIVAGRREGRRLRGDGRRSSTPSGRSRSISPVGAVRATGICRDRRDTGDRGPARVRPSPRPHRPADAGGSPRPARRAHRSPRFSLPSTRRPAPARTVPSKAAGRRSERETNRTIRNTDRGGERPARRARRPARL